jgi:hypothetical protein
LFFEERVSGKNFLCRMNGDGTGRQRVVSAPIIQWQSVSPDGKWVVAQAAVSGEKLTRAVVAYSTRDGSRRRICDGLCTAAWSQDGTRFNLKMPGGHTYSIPLRRGEAFPPALGLSGVKSEAALRALKGVKTLEWNIYFAPHSSTYAFYREAVRRNIYRIPIP